MALINRLARLVKADFHAVLDNIEEPEQQLKLAIREMEDDLASTEQRISLCAHEQKHLAFRTTELNAAIAEIDTQLDLCFESNKEALARTLIRKKLEAQSIQKRLACKHAANEEYLGEQQAIVNENRATLESCKQKAELFAKKPRSVSETTSASDELAWAAREMHIGEDEIEIAFLREKDARVAT